MSTPQPFARSTARWLASLVAAMVLILTAGLGSEAKAQLGLGDEERVRFSVRTEPAKVEPGGTVEVIATYEHDEGWHIYAPDFTGTGTPTRLEVDSKALEPLGEVAFPEPKLVEIEVLGETQRLLDGKGELRRKYRVAESVAPGTELEIDVLLTYQTCTETTCLVPVKGRPHPLTLTVADDRTTVSDGDAGDAAAPAPDATQATPSLLPLPTKGDSLLGPGALSGALGAEGGESDAKSPVRFDVTFESPRAAPGGTVDILARYEIEDGWHIYSPDFEGIGTPTRIEAPAELLTPVGPPRFPEPKIHRIEVLNETQRLLEGKGMVRQTFRVASRVTAGEPLEVPVTVHFQACTDTTCLVPEMSSALLELQITGRAAPGPKPPGSRRGTGAEGTGTQGVTEPPPPTGAPVETGTEGTGSQAVTEPPPPTGAPEGSATPSSAGDAAGGLGTLSLLKFIGLMVAGGLFTLFMPCTYPMIPLTISFFTKQADLRKGSTFGLALVYGLGIVLSFVLIGVVVVFGMLSAENIQSFASNPWVNLTFAILLVLFGFVLVGLFTPRLPAGVARLASRAMGSGGYTGVFGLGATLCVTSFTCTAPIMGWLLVLAASGTDGSVERVILGMAVFGGTIALPFVVLALAPGWVRSLPRAGEWMETLKVSLGLLELAAALKFFSMADLVLAEGRERALDGSLALWLPRDVFLLAWAAIALVAAFVLLGFIRLKGSTGEIGSGRLLAGVTAFFLAFYSFIAAQGHPLPDFLQALPPPAPIASAQAVPGNAATPGEANGEVGPQVTIAHSWEEGLAIARERNLAAVVDFTGPTCAVCRTMEEVVFPKLPDLLARVVQIRLNTDENSDQEKHLELQRQLVKTSARPSYALVDPADPMTPISTFLLPPEAKSTTRMGVAFRGWLEPLLDARDAKGR